jgi:yecA family protein
MNTSSSRSPSTPLRIPQTLSRLQQGRLRASLAGWDGKAPLILDAGCGVGHSTIQLARAFPDHWVIGVDQSEDRLSRKPYPDALMPTNMVFVRADLVDYWRLMAEAGIRLARHYILYPNPGPRSATWPGAGMRIRCFPCAAARRAAGMPQQLEHLCGRIRPRAGPADRPRGEGGLRGPVAAHPFERKYRDSGQTLYRCVVELDRPWRKTRHDPSPIHPLSEDELEQLEELLVSDDVPADCMNLEMLDGYLAAIVASPLPIPVEDWLPAVWTADEGEVGFGSGATLQKAIELVLRYYNDMLATIGDEEGDEEGEAEGWQPFCYAQGGDDDPAIGEEWTNGFEQGFEMWPPSGPTRWATPPSPRRCWKPSSAPKKKCGAADLETSWPNLRRRASPSSTFTRTGVPSACRRPSRSRGCRRAAGGPGRNEPCPCGSGKKYKKCCGAN